MAGWGRLGECSPAWLNTQWETRWCPQKDQTCDKFIIPKLFDCCVISSFFLLLLIIGRLLLVYPITKTTQAVCCCNMYIVFHQINSSMPLSEICHHNVIKHLLMKVNTCLTIHRWQENETDITTLGFFINVNPGNYLPRKV